MFDCTIEYRKGTNNQCADSLSRICEESVVINLNLQQQDRYQQSCVWYGSEQVDNQSPDAQVAVNKHALWYLATHQKQHKNNKEAKQWHMNNQQPLKQSGIIRIGRIQVRMNSQQNTCKQLAIS
jgi:hypothetical protein